MIPVVAATAACSGLRPVAKALGWASSMIYTRGIGKPACAPVPAPARKMRPPLRASTSRALYMRKHQLVRVPVGEQIHRRRRTEARSACPAPPSRTDGAEQGHDSRHQNGGFEPVTEHVRLLAAPAGASTSIRCGWTAHFNGRAGCPASSGRPARNAAAPSACCPPAGSHAGPARRCRRHDQLVRFGAQDFARCPPNPTPLRRPDFERFTVQQRPRTGRRIVGTHRARQHVGRPVQSSCASSLLSLAA